MTSRSDMKRKDVEKFFYELGMLKNMQRSGWFTLGIFQGDSVASHSFRATIIAYYLAKKLNANIEKTVIMTLFHDVPEARTGDLNKVNSSYVKADKKAAREDQLSLFPEIIELLEEFEKQETVESQIARDSDILEVIIQAKEYENKNPLAKEFYVNAYSRLLLEESKELADRIISSQTTWWKGLKNLKR